MKEFDAFEKSIKESIGGLASTKPGKLLWYKINVSLLFAFIFRKANILLGIISLVFIGGFVWLYANNISSHSVNSTSIKNNEIEINNLTNYNVNYSFIDENARMESSILFETNNFQSQNYLSNIISNYSSVIPFSLPNTNSQNIANIGFFRVGSISNCDNKLNVSMPDTTSVQHDINNVRELDVDMVKSSGPNQRIDTERNSNANQKVYSNQNNSANQNLVVDVVDAEGVYSKNNSGNNNNNIMSLSEYKILKMKLIAYSYSYKSKNLIKEAKLKSTDDNLYAIHTDYEVFMGPSLNYSLFNLNPNNTVDKELSKSSLLPSYHFGGNYNLYYKSWFLKFGINYADIKEQISFTANKLNIDSRTYYYTIVSNTYIWDTIGWNTNIGNSIDSIPIVSLDVQQTSVQSSITEYDSTISVQKQLYSNSYSSINIPLLVGRRFDFDNFVFDVAAGISWSHLTKIETHIIDPVNGEVVFINQDNDNIRKDILNGVLAFGVGYKLKGLNTLFIRPELQYNFNSIFDKTYFSNYKVFQMRFSIGLQHSIR